MLEIYKSFFKGAIAMTAYINHIQKAFSFLLCIVIIIALAALPCSAEESDSRVIRVGWFEAENESNSASNSLEYYREYLRALSQYTGWKYEYINGTWDECLLMLERGEIDILGFVQKNDDREKIFGYPSLPMTISSGYLVAGNGNEISAADKGSLNGITVGIVKGNGYNKDFEKYRIENGFDVTYKEYNSLADISPALERGEIDAAVVAEEDKTVSERIVMNFATYDQYFATDIDDPAFLRELDNAMKSVNTYCPYLNQDLYQKYFAVNNDGKPVFTAAEQKFIKNNPNILVLYDTGWPPIEYWDEENAVYRGISPDLFALLSEKCGINFVYEGSTSGEVLAELQSGENKNTLTTISYDYGWADSHDVYITQPFITSTIVKLGKNPDAKNPTVAVNEKAFFTYILADELKGVSTINFSKQAERLEAVRTGKADYTFVTEDQANYYRSIPKYSDLKVKRMVGYEQKVCVSVEKNSDPELMSIISKSLASISHDEMTAILRANTEKAYKLTFGDRIYQNRVTIIISSIIAAIILGTLITILAMRYKSSRIIKVAYKQKEEALVIAEQASAAKGSFMSRMSHEIRTPLNAVIGYNTIAKNELSNAKTDEERRSVEMKVMDCLTKSEVASKHLLTIINDVLDMSAIESGKIKISHDRFDFKGLITSLTTIFYSQASAKGVSLEVIIGDLENEWFIGDQMRTNQILTNLLSNAIKFTSEGGSVKLSIRQLESEDEKVKIHFEVKDTGIGMTSEYLTHIWTPFEQADSSISRRFGGTGLGLSITKNLVELMDGKIEVDSKPGIGTAFTVELEYEKGEELEDNGTYDFKNINALVADNDPNTCDYIRLLFNRCGARCATVTSGADAIEALKRSIAENNCFSMCLVDWRMPQMDGIETIKHIREIAGDQIPVIVLTAYDYTEIADKAVSVGVNRFISKPLFQSSLFDLLANICGICEEKAVIPEKPREYNFNGARVILAEDNLMNMEIAKRLIAPAGLNIDCAWNGNEAVELYENAEAGTYAAILMDVHMPALNGYDATMKIRTSEHTDAKSIPIIAMTADAFAEDIAEAIAAGMTDHISKPIDTGVLFDKLAKYILK